MKPGVYFILKHPERVSIGDPLYLTAYPESKSVTAIPLLSGDRAKNQMVRSTNSMASSDIQELQCQWEVRQISNHDFAILQYDKSVANPLGLKVDKPASQVTLVASHPTSWMIDSSNHTEDQETFQYVHHFQL